jgi:hypothetical protein
MVYVLRPERMRAAALSNDVSCMILNVALLFLIKSVTLFV